MPAEHFRRDRMLALADLVSGRGLEIGPLDRAIAVKPDFDVRYVDVYDAPAIRAHYQDDPNVDIRAIPDVDFALHTPDGRIQTLVQAVSAAAPYRWVLASHVAEHVPDLIGWLHEIAEILEDGGKLVLAVPDRRYTFDSLRPPTTVGQLLQANVSGDRTPSVRAVFDHFRSAVHVSADQRWAGVEVDERDLIHGLPEAMEKVQLARNEYVDCHVWLFTPMEFAAQLADLGEMGLSDLYLSALLPTAPGEIEFYVALSRIPRACSKTEASRIRRLSRDRLVIPHVPATVPAAHSDPQHSHRANGSSIGSANGGANGSTASTGTGSNASNGAGSARPQAHTANGAATNVTTKGAAASADALDRSGHAGTRPGTGSGPASGSASEATTPATGSAGSPAHPAEFSVSDLEIRLIQAKRRIINVLLRRDKPVTTR